MIKLYRFISGEEIIGEIVSETLDGIYLKNVVALSYQPMKDGRLTAGFSAFMPYADGYLQLNPDTISISADIRKEMLDEYNRIFSPIIQPPSGIIS